MQLSDKNFYWPTISVLALAVGLIQTDATHAQTFTEDEIKQLVLEAIRENPEIVMEAVAILEQQERSAQAAAVEQVLSSNRDALELDPNAPFMGAANGDVTIVEFFDYNCPYCKQAAPEVEALIAADSNVRVVYREWPILGEGSVFAARAALASREQGLYEEFHWALMNLQGRAGEASVLAAANLVGLDVPQLLADMEAPSVDAHIDVSMELTRALGFSGTPSFVVGDALVPGFIEQSALEQLVADSREAQER